jgi:isoleucyl-tRNA synthetase
MPFSTGCNTPLSNFEASQNYKDVQDPAGTVPLKEGGREREREREREVWKYSS